MLRNLIATSGVAIIILSALSAWNPAPSAVPLRGPGAVIAMHEQLFRAMDALDIDKALSFLHEDMNMGEKERSRPCTLFLVDGNGKPLTALGYQESRKLLADWIQALSSEGRYETKVTALGADCFSAELSYAVLEFERLRTVNGKQTTQRYRSTSLVTYDAGWKITHWHVSKAEAPLETALVAPPVK
jgi:hypothetical protein